MPVTVTKHHTYTGHDGSLYALEKSAAGKFFTGGSDRIVCEWSLDPAASPLGLVNVGAIIYSLCHVTESNMLLIGTSTGHLHVVDLAHRKEVRNIQHHQQGIFDIKYSQKFNRLFTAAADGTVAIWKLDDLSLLSTIQIGQQKIRAVAVHPVAEEITVCSGDGQLVTLHALTGSILHRRPAHQFSCNSAVYSPDGNLLISGGRDAHLNVWDAISHQLIKSIPAHNYAIYAFAFSPDGQWLASASRDKTVKLWDAESFDVLIRLDKEKFDGHRNSVNKIIWMEHPHGLLSTGDDRSVMSWSVSIL
jgi:WD40 repeat protein